MTVTDDDLTRPVTPDDLAEQDAPTPYDPLMALTAEELSAGSRALKASIFKALTEGTEQYERALAVLLWLHERRHSPQVPLARFLTLPFSQLSDDIEALGPEQPDPTTPPSSPA